MLGALVGIVVLVAATLGVHAVDNIPSRSDERFTYDYYRLRVIGLVAAAVLCVIGIVILLAAKCRCKFNQKKRSRSNSGVPTAQHLLEPGEATEC
ncbi:phospholemman isoform X2 [Pristis pectinata]|nr:phospholemman isoform X2 [Pristis pectinata]XP_051901529.1 phospholemman isoform X2 [Pristis pectinata]XP_051901530.1 phospholemman isoform X2 [Pristis pectinata]